MTIEVNQIADGHNNVAGLVSVDQLSPPLFWRYAGFGLLSEWHEYEGRGLGGDHQYVGWGRPWVAWRLQVLSQAEVQYLRDSFGVSVTIHAYDKGSASWKDFNATLLLPDLSDPAWATWDSDVWVNVRLEFRDLVEIV